MEGKVGIIGGGIMGRGIAQLALQHGHSVCIIDNTADTLTVAYDTIEKQLTRQTEKNKISTAEKNDCMARLSVASDITVLSDCAIVIEAIIEDLAAKRAIFAKLETMVSGDCLLASNTSTLSITAIATQLREPRRLVGIHFFNPAPLMRLVEIIRGLETAPAIIERATALARHWQKKPVISTSMPGFIVNRVARPFYCEALALLENRCATIDDIDTVLSGSGVFPMGAFSLIDLIGVDTNMRNTLSLYNAYYQEKRFRPSPIQQEYVDGGRLGKKSGCGFFQYIDGKTVISPALHPRGAPPPKKVIAYAPNGLAAILAQRAGADIDGSVNEQKLSIDGLPLFISDGQFVADKRQQCGKPCVMSDWVVCGDKTNVVALAASADCGENEKNIAAGFFQSLGMDVIFINDTAGMIIHRVLCLLINEALFAIMQGVCSVDDCDTALAYGMNFSPPPLMLAQQLGYATILTSLQTLHHYTGEDKFSPSAELYRQARQTEQTI